ncbi:MAG: hypothetical protein ACYCQM_01630 [Acidithiobacillus sp.]
MAAIAVRGMQLPGVQIAARWHRYYPYCPYCHGMYDEEQPLIKAGKLTVRYVPKEKITT